MYAFRDACLIFFLNLLGLSKTFHSKGPRNSDALGYGSLPDQEKY
jgi:hypothetical protein